MISTSAGARRAMSQRDTEPQKRKQFWICFFMPLCLGGAFTSSTSRQHPLRLGFDAAEVVIRADVERGAVVAPGAVGGGDAGFEHAEQFALGGNNQNAAGAAEPDVAFNVDLHAVGHAGELLRDEGGGVE